MALRHKLGWDPHFVRRSAWFWPLAAAAGRFAVCADWPSRAQLAAAYTELALPAGAEPLEFVENVRKQDKHAAGKLQLARLYDARITRDRQVPTRERDWHDFFNALCFITFPRAKRALHARQFAILQARVAPDAVRLPAARTPEQDALTLFDEGGAVIAAEPAAHRRLSTAAEPELAAVLAELTQHGSARVVPFGHALFEHVVEGLRCPGGSTQIIQLAALGGSDAQLLRALDGELTALLADPSYFTTPRQAAHLRLHTLGLG